MSATLVAKDLSAAHGTRALFSGLDLVVAPGDVVGLVGANGAGKSTLLRLLAGLDAPESGRVTLSPPTATVGYLPQEPDRRAGESIAAFLGRRTGVDAAQAEMDAAAVALGAGEGGADDRYGDALERWLALGGADLEERRGEVLADLGLQVDVEVEMPALSGGQAARVGLAALLLSRYDVFLLDEPTNDLDLDGLARLEKFVGELRSPAVVVSHDREFLARTVDRVVELDLAQQLVRVVGGGYEAFLAERETQRRHAREAYDDYAETKAGLEGRARMQRNWMDKGVRNAVRKGEPDKNIRAKMREGSEKQAAKARQTDRMIERLDVIEEPRKEWALQMTIAAAARSGSVVTTVREAVVGRGGFRLGPVTLQVEAGDRIAVTGPNGSGKTTLLGLLLGRIDPDEGTVSLGSGVEVGEVDQARGLFLGEQPLARAFGDAVPQLPDAEVRTLLAKFGLGSAHVGRATSTLSPGERTRAALALLQARGVNLLVLDEPTNHLDLPAIEQLEQALASYSGTLLLVSHDRRLLDAVEVTRRLAVDAGTVREL
ncbi:MAG: ABC-F family ATP-binding cassette domain-containing protein [Janthinobacterium lividum]